MSYVDERLAELGSPRLANPSGRRDYYRAYYWANREVIKARRAAHKRMQNAPPPSTGGVALWVASKGYWTGRYQRNSYAACSELLTEAHRFPSRAAAYEAARDVRGLQAAVPVEVGR